MANLTGDFDVIAQFAVPAVNRVLAAMHRIERFPHSLSLRVDDTPRHGRDFDASVVNVLDVYGDVVSDHSSIRNPRPIDIGDFLPGSPSGRIAAALGAIANIDLAGIHIGPLEPSHLKGRAQVQLFPPTLELNDSSGTRVTIRMEMISRYFADPGTSVVAQFVRGDLRIGASINQVVSQVGSVISIDVKASSAVISFTPHWSSSPISAADLAGISQLIRNAISTSTLPSNATLPSNIGHIQFKTLSGSPGAVAVMLDMDGAAGNPATANQSFLGSNDGFAFGIGADYLRAAFQPTLDNILAEQVEPVKFNIDGYVHTWHITYVITLNSAALELQNGKMVLIVKGHAHTGTSWLPDFNFTFKQDVTLAVSGNTAELAFGNMSLDTSSTIVDIFKSRAMSALARVRTRAIDRSHAQEKVRDMLSAETNLGGFLKSLLTPARTAQPLPPLDFTLSYTSAEIRQTGVILHGLVSIPSPPPPRVDFETITAAPGSPTLPTDAVASGPDYTGLKSWIPGGTIDSYTWHHLGSQGYTDQNKFVLLDEGPSTTAAMSHGAGALGGHSPMCLTIRGKRLTSTGPVTEESVTATMCAFNSFPLGDLAVAGGIVALARRGSGGMVDIVGHASPAQPSPDRTSPNLIVHFADEVSGENLGALSEALKAAGRADAPAGIVAVAKASRLTRLPFSESVTYVEDDGQWRRQLGVSSSGSSTVVVDPSGKPVWKGDGPINERELAAALGKVLVNIKPPKPRLLSASARIGQPAPNFLFEHAPGQPLTLRKISGRPVTIVFFNQTSEPSIDAVQDAERESAGKSIVLAVQNGGAKGPRDAGGALVVNDRDGHIARAYGVTMWPTIISVDENGIIRSIAYGRHTKGDKSRA